MAQPESPFFLAYPPDNHQTQANQIFFIGSAPPGREVEINGEPVARSAAGHFAPSLPLVVGPNTFILRYQGQEIRRTITRLNNQPTLPSGLGFIPDSLQPAFDLARLPQDLICFSAIAKPNSTVTVSLGKQNLGLSSQGPVTQLPANAALLIGTNQPQTSALEKYQACQRFSALGNLGRPLFKIQSSGQVSTQEAKGSITIVSPDQQSTIAVKTEVGVTRTGPSTNHARLTPLPQGTQAMVTGREGDWWRLDHGAWINRAETQVLPQKNAILSPLRSVGYRRLQDATEIRFPLEVPVAIAVEPTLDHFKLTLHNTIAQTDTIRLDGDDPVIKLLTWQQVTPTQVDYTLQFKSPQQWGYDLRYEDTTLILSLRHPPQRSKNAQSLQGVKILLDPGHGGAESGSVGPNGYPEKAINLLISQQLAQKLRQRGAIVYLTRDSDVDVSLAERVRQINTLKPAIAVSIHYNALPDGGDALKTQGISTFWYHPQAQPLAAFLQADLVKRLNRPSYGLYWNNLALTRPHSVPTVLLELGFMINPQEFEWITDPSSQRQLVDALADSLTEWLRQDS